MTNTELEKLRDRATLSFILSDDNRKITKKHITQFVDRVYEELVAKDNRVLWCVFDL